MPTLIERMERMCGYSGLNIAAPYADIKLMEYVWGIPWDIKRKNVKYILREAARNKVPDELLERKKKPVSQDL